MPNETVVVKLDNGNPMFKVICGFDERYVFIIDISIYDISKRTNARLELTDDCVQIFKRGDIFKYDVSLIDKLNKFYAGNKNAWNWGELEQWTSCLMT